MTWNIEIRASRHIVRRTQFLLAQNTNTDRLTVNTDRLTENTDRLTVNTAHLETNGQ